MSRHTSIVVATLNEMQLVEGTYACQTKCIAGIKGRFLS